ncbi:hypothetical protein Zm00014a_016211 [Zea mays]|uniref:Uncharacterized protein n=1 Tax=Zea mays TaxID=4577 RepID=A0A317Y4J1_MAIZE|nr:hypothetical protein Zm00014a_016211 [Zea mays]
MFLANFSS